VIILVRHGRTAANAGGLLLGRADPVLDDEGERQAACLAAELPPSLGGPVTVVSSPLARCRATADAIAAAAGVDVRVDDRWIELDYGELDGVPVSSVPGETWAAWQSDVTWPLPGGESLDQVGRRVRAACEDLLEPASSGTVVVVSHVSPIKAAVAWALGVGDEIAWRLYLAPASITRVGLVAGRPTVRSFNETAHLD
jgi:broad specificity phosphatase PhoE